MESDKLKLKFILSSCLVLFVLAILTPVLIGPKAGGMVENLAQGLLSVSLFLVIAYLWNDFNKLRIQINKDELEDKDLTKLEHNVDKLAGLKSDKK